MNKYQVFIASSLRIQEHREAATKAINAANEADITKQYQIEFGPFKYENCTDITQKVEKNDAQEPIDNELKKSTLFFLIIDDVIRSMTRYEFELALEQFEKGSTPQYIFILYNGKPMKSNSEGMNFEDFMKYENLIDYVADRHYNIIPHRKVYAIPFTDIADLQVKITHQLLAFVESKDRPFPGAERGYNLTKEHFFKDGRRKDKCPETYHRRDFDDLLDSAIREGNYNFVALVGLSLSGKTRAVMESMKAVDNGWVYIVNMEDAVAELGRLSLYLRQIGHPKLYIVLDDYDLWAGQEQVADALNNLFGIIWNSKDVIVATASSKRLLPNDVLKTIIEIKEMDKSEIANARDFFVSAAVPFDKENLYYHRIGALFVNLKELKIDYERWLDKEDDKELMKVTKKKLLKAIKALSIWRDDNIGNRSLMESVTAWFCKQEMMPDDCWTDVQLAKASHKVLNDLVKIGRMGVSSTSESAPIIVQEYIYRYFIDYDGSLLKEGEEASLEKQKNLMIEILQFCKDTLKDEPLTAQVSRLCRRCAYRSKTVRWLYDLWMGEGEIAPSDIELSKLLNEDRVECEKNHNDRITHFYSNVIETYIYCCCEDMKEARNAYDQCSQDMVTDHLFSALMRKAKDSEERKEIRKLPNYNKNLSYIIAVETEWAENYIQAEEWTKRFALFNKKTHEMAKYVIDKDKNESSDKERPYDLLQLRRSIVTLAFKVTCQHEYESYCSLIRYLYPYLTDDIGLLKDVRNHQYSPEKLTCIDLLAVIPPFALLRMLSNVFGGNLIACEIFVRELLDDIEKTLDGHFTDEQSLRLTFGYVVSMLIRQLSEVPFDEVYERIFEPLKIKYKKRTLILRNIYTYTAMLSNSTCDKRAANRLLTTDLQPHILDKDNPLSINTVALNMIIKKSIGRNDSFSVDAVKEMYEKMGKKYDDFTYRLLMSVTTNCKEGLCVLEEAVAHDIKPIVNILCELLKRPYVQLNTALTMLDVNGVDKPDKYELNPFEYINGLDPSKTIDIIRDNREKMSDTHIAWGYLFKKKCNGEIDKTMMTSCLSFLKTEKPDLLEDGFIYNCLIENETYLPSVNDVVSFIKQNKNESFPDFYTATCLIDRICHLYGTDRLKANSRLNELLRMIMDGKTCRLDNRLVNKRLKIFRNQGESLEMDFYDEKGQNILKKGKHGKMRPMLLSASLYLKTMCDYGYPVSSYTIANFMAIKDGLADDPYTKLTEKAPKILSVLTTPTEQNKIVLWKFKAGKIKIIKDAIRELKWDNIYDTVCIFGEILNHYIDSQVKTLDLFEEVVKYYNSEIKDKGISPTTITLSVLAKATTRWEDMEWILDEFDIQKGTNPRLTLQPQLLTAVSNFANTVQELIAMSNTMQKKGCHISTKAADAFVFRMTNHLLVYDRENASSILNDLCQYIFGDGNKSQQKQLLVSNKRNSLMLDLYKNKRNVSASLLRNLIYYNVAETQKYNKEQIMKCIKKKNIGCIISLMEKLANDSTNDNPIPYLPLRKDMDQGKAKQIAEEIANTYIPKLFPQISESKRPSLSKRLLSFIAYTLSTAYLNNYRQFLKQLYEMDCWEFEGAVPGLAAFLKKWLDNSLSPNKDFAVASKTLAQIIVYAKLEKLRNGHTLLEEAPEQNASWCSRLMNCEEILEYDDIQWKNFLNLSWSELIQKYIPWLDDAYPCCLALYHDYGNNNPMDDKMKAIIRQQEKRYALAIEAGEVYFRDVRKLPQMWYDADNWVPTEELLMAMIRCLSRLACNPDVKGIYLEYKKDAYERYVKIEKGYAAAAFRSDDFLIYHNVLGPIYTKKGKKAIPHKISIDAMRALMYDMYLDRVAEYCANVQYITKSDKKKLRDAEQWCTEFIEKKGNKMGWLMAWMQQLPERWIKIKDRESRVNKHAWCPDEAIVLAMLKNYLRVSKGIGKKACIAREHIDEVKNAMNDARKGRHTRAKVTYSMLGVMEDKDYYLLVPLKSLSKVIRSEKTKNPAQ